MMVHDNLTALETQIGYTFQNISFLKQALTHSSYANEMKINKHNDYERIEFLGDAVLELISSEFIFLNNKEMTEGNMTRLRASMVCEPALSYCARTFGLQEYICLGKGEEATGGRNRDSIIADVMEAVIGAIYLDGGIEPAKEFIHTHILTDLEDKILFYDAKSILQEIVQKNNKGSLQYKLISEKGPDHDKTFEVKAYVGETEIGYGVGRTKKSAEQQAAYQALLKLKEE